MNFRRTDIVFLSLFALGLVGCLHGQPTVATTPDPAASTLIVGPVMAEQLTRSVFFLDANQLSTYRQFEGFESVVSRILQRQFHLPAPSTVAGTTAAERASLAMAVIAAIQRQNPTGTYVDYQSNGVRMRAYIQPTQQDTRCEHPVVVSDFTGTLAPLRSGDPAVAALNSFVEQTGATLWVLSRLANNQTIARWSRSFPAALASRVVAVPLAEELADTSLESAFAEADDARDRYGKMFRLVRVLGQNHCLLGIAGEESGSEGAIARRLGTTFYEIPRDGDVSLAWVTHVQTMGGQVTQRRTRPR